MKEKLKEWVYPAFATWPNPIQPNPTKSNQMYCWKLNVATVIVKLEIYLLLIIIYLFMQGWHENFKKKRKYGKITNSRPS